MSLAVLVNGNVACGFGINIRYFKVTVLLTFWYGYTVVSNFRYRHMALLILHFRYTVFSLTVEIHGTFKLTVCLPYLRSQGMGIRYFFIENYSVSRIL